MAPQGKLTPENDLSLAWQLVDRDVIMILSKSGKRSSAVDVGKGVKDLLEGLGILVPLSRRATHS